MFVVIVLSACGCHSRPLLIGHPVALSANAESLAGLRAAPEFEERFGGTVADPIAQRRMERLAQRFADTVPSLAKPWHFHLLASDKINAFSLPGGLIYITQGLYQRIGARDPLLAAVIAHEMAHIARKDSFKRPCRDTDEALNREMAADAQAIGYLKNARFPHESLPDVLHLIRDAQPTGWAQHRLDRLRQGHDTWTEQSATTLAKQ